MVTVLILQPSVHKLATPFSIHCNLCVPLPLHNCQIDIHLLLVLYCVVFYLDFYVNVNYGCAVKIHKYFWTCICSIRGGNRYFFHFFLLHGGNPTTFVRGAGIYAM